MPAGVSAKTPDWLLKTAIEEHYDFGAFIEIRKIKKINMVTSLKGNE